MREQGNSPRRVYDKATRQPGERWALRARTVSAALVFAALGGCTTGDLKLQDSAKPDRPEVRPVAFAIHLAYDEARPDCEKAASKRGETVYVAPAAELDRSDLEAARALHSGTRSMLQLVLNYTGRRRLEELTRANCWQTGSRAAPAPQQAATTPPRLAVLINGELVCAPYIDRVVGSGEIQIVDVFSSQECEDLAAGLNARSRP